MPATYLELEDVVDRVERLRTARQPHGVTDEEKKERDAALLTLAMTANEFAAIQPIYSAVSAKGFKVFFDCMDPVPNRSDWALFQGPYELARSTVARL